MTAFIGTRCIVCAEKFNKQSDVVVCPDCGTPYHRDCWFKNEKCVNTALHENKRAWKPTYDIGSEEVLCRACGEMNPPLTLFCEHCGNVLPTLEIYGEKLANRQRQQQAGAYDSRLNEDPKAFNRNEYGGVSLAPYLINFSDRLCGYSPDEEFEGVKLSEIGDFVDTNTHYYLPVFKRIKETGKKIISFNITAMAFPELYFANRKMPFVAVIVCLLRFITILPNLIVFAASNPQFGALSELVSVFDIKGVSFQMLHMTLYSGFYLIMILGGGLANWIYYKLSLKKISDIKARLKDTAGDLTARLKKKGGTSGLLLTLFIVVDALPFIVLYFFQASDVMGRVL